MRKLTNYFSFSELCLWSVSVLLIVASFLAFDRENHLTLPASLIGVTSLIFNAKANPFGQLQRYTVSFRGCLLHRLPVQ